MDVADLVRDHYRGDDLEGAILQALADAGVDTDRLSVADLAPIDQLHAGFLPSTTYLLEKLHLGPESRLLDVGCGIGGPARVAASTYDCATVGVDLAPDFVRAGQALTDRVGLSQTVQHHLGSGDALEFDDGSFDRAMIIHVGMNIPDKKAVFAEVRRVLEIGGLFGVYEQMRVGEGEPTYPLPWAEDARSSFVEPVYTYVELLQQAGFVVEHAEDRRPAVARPPDGQSRLSPVTVFGPRFAERIGNNIAATRAGILAPVVLVARAA